MKSVSHAIALVCLVAIAIASRTAFAQMAVEIQPIFGNTCVPNAGPTELVVGVANASGNTTSGTVTLEPIGASYQPGVRTVYSAPFNIGPRASVTLRVPVPPTGVSSNDLMLNLRDASGRAITQRPVRFENLVDHLFIDATPQSRLAYALRAAQNPDPMAITGGPSPLAGLATGLTPCAAMRMPQTGDVVLPRHVAGYNGVSVLLADAATIMSLPAAERTALADWILSGGTLMVIPQRADELRHATLQAMLGQGITSVTPPPLDPTNGQWIAAIPGSPIGSFPLAATLAHIESFQGGNLHTRHLAPLFPWGAANLLGGSAEYGFGHVHVLSFNPAMPPAIEDPWAVGVVTRLAQQVTTTGQHTIDDAPEVTTVPNAVRRSLDPNEGFRPGLGFAVVLLIVYAIVAGPVAFRLSARAKKPLRGLAILPGISALVFGGIVALGGVSRGFQGRSRRVAVFELPAGMSRGPMRRYHGYFSGESGGLTVVTPHADHRLYVDPTSGSGYVTLALLRDRTQLRGLALTPWTTLVVREEGYETLPGSITLQPDTLGRVRIVNHMPVALRDVIVIAPGGSEAWSFREIAAGQTRLATMGTVVPLTTLGSFITGSFIDSTPTLLPGTADNPTLHPGYQLASLFGGDPDDVRNWDAALGALPTLGTNNTAQPLLVAQVAFPLPSNEDGGLRVDRDASFIRVVGWGGAQ